MFLLQIRYIILEHHPVSIGTLIQAILFISLPLWNNYYVVFPSLLLCHHTRRSPLACPIEMATIIIHMHYRLEPLSVCCLYSSFHRRRRDTLLYFGGEAWDQILYYNISTETSEEVKSTNDLRDLQEKNIMANAHFTQNSKLGTCIVYRIFSTNGSPYH